MLELNIKHIWCNQDKWEMVHQARDYSLKLHQQVGGNAAWFTSYLEYDLAYSAKKYWVILLENQNNFCAAHFQNIFA